MLQSKKQTEISSVVDTLVKPNALTSPRRVLSIHLNAEEISKVYHSFLVRLWQEHPNASWRASAQSVQSGKLIHFATLDALTEFLYAQTRGEANDKKIDHKKEIPS